MKINDIRSTEPELDSICAVCNQSLIIEGPGAEIEKYGELRGDFTDCSKQDVKRYHMKLCERCFKVALLALRDERRANVMFDEKANLPDENFGLKVPISS